MNKIIVVAIVELSIVGFITLSYLIITNKMECIVKSIIRTIHRPIFIDGKLKIISGHNFKQFYEGKDYWYNKELGELGSKKDVQVLKCKDCGALSIAYNHNPDDK